MTNKHTDANSQPQSVFLIREAQNTVTICKLLQVTVIKKHTNTTAHLTAAQRERQLGLTPFVAG